VTPGDVEFVEVLASMTVCTGGVAAILVADDRRKSRRSEHAWLPATRDAAILGTFLFSWLYGCPALVIHFVKSRWSPAGWGLGLLWAALLFAANAGALLAIEWLCMV
jgi:hypothetical protein